jgi:hypothetical protein
MRAEGAELGAERQVGRPAAVRLCRLTLAPHRWATAELGAPEGKVRSLVSADSDRALEAAAIEAPSSGSSVGSSADPLLGLRKAGSGSRFWILSEDEDEDESSECSSVADVEEDQAGRGGDLASHHGESPQGPSLGEGLASMYDRGASSTGSSQRSSARTLWSGKCESRGDKHTCERRDLDFHWLRPVGKPWWGPLPPARVSPRVSLGDVPATDYRHAMGGSVQRLSDLNGACVVPPGARSSLVREPPPQGKTKGIRCDRWFKKRIPVTTRFLCQGDWAVAG